MEQDTLSETEPIPGLAMLDKTYAIPGSDPPIVTDPLPESAAADTIEESPVTAAKTASLFLPMYFVAYTTIFGPVLFFTLGLWILNLQRTEGPDVLFGVMTFFLAGLSLTLLIGNVVRSFRVRGEDAPRYSVDAMLITKYGMIPFFILHVYVTPITAVLLGLSGLTVFYWYSVVYMLLAPLVFLLPGAFYGIRVIRFSLREKKLHPIAAVFLGIFQFIPVLDILAAATLSAVTWKRARIISLIVLLAAPLFLLLLFVFDPLEIYRFIDVPAFFK